MTDTARQEVELTFGGKTFRVRPDFETVTNIEDTLGGQACRALGLKCWAATLSQATRTARGLTSEITLKECAAIVYMMLRDKPGGPKSIQEVGETIMEYGMDDMLIPLSDFLIRAKIGHKEHEREAELQLEKKKREAGEDDAKPDPQTP